MSFQGRHGEAGLAGNDDDNADDNADDNEDDNDDDNDDDNHDDICSNDDDDN